MRGKQATAPFGAGRVVGRSKAVLRSAQDDNLKRDTATAMAASGKVAISVVNEPLFQTQVLVVTFLVNHNISHFVPWVRHRSLDL